MFYANGQPVEIGNPVIGRNAEGAVIAGIIVSLTRGGNENVTVAYLRPVANSMVPVNPQDVLVEPFELAYYCHTTVPIANLFLVEDRLLL